MAIVFDASSSRSSGGSPTGSLGVLHTVADNTDGLLCTFIRIIGPPGDGLVITSASLGGTNMTFQNRFQSTLETFDNIELWTLKTPPTGTNLLKVSASGATGRLIIGATSWTGVDQTTPFGSVFVTESNSSTITNTVTSATGEVVVDGGASSGTRTFTVGGGQTQRVQLNTDDTIVCSNEAGAASVVMSWTIVESPDIWTSTAISLKPAGGTPPFGPGNFVLNLHQNPAPTYDFAIRLSDPVTNVDVLIIWIGEEAWAT